MHGVVWEAIGTAGISQLNTKTVDNGSAWRTLAMNVQTQVIIKLQGEVEEAMYVYVNDAVHIRTLEDLLGRDRVREGAGEANSVYTVYLPDLCTEYVQR